MYEKLMKHKQTQLVSVLDDSRQEKSTRTSGARGEAQAVKAVPGSWTGGVLTRS